MSQIKQMDDGGFGIEGKDYGKGSFIFKTVNYNVPVAATAQLVAYAARSFVLDEIAGYPFVAGTDAGAVTAALWMAPSGTAPTSGTALHTGSINLKGTVYTEQELTLSATQIPKGNLIWVVYTGVGTAAIGGISVVMRPA
jgi:hypothetical protein